jgi:hypothetical protein
MISNSMSDLLPYSFQKDFLLRALQHPIIIATLSLLLAMPATAQQWLPVKDKNLEVAQGSILDFSTLVEPGPAGRHGRGIALPDGHVGFENQRKPQRFLSASFAFSAASGGVPDKEEAERLAIQLRRAGYNAARLHFIDAWLMTGRSGDFDFDRDRLDRLHYFMSQLKANGIYWVIDILDSDNGAYGGIYPHRWIKKHNLRLDFYTDKDKRDHWLRLTKDIFATRNPYTGVSILEDPALLSVILINEGGVAELTYRSGPGGFTKPYSNKFAPLFMDWLKNRYASDAALKAAWDGELRKSDSLAASVALPASLRGNDPRTRDFMRFIVDLEHEALRWMTDHVRQLGYKGFVTAYNNWGFHQSDLSRSGANWVDMHSYQANPSDFVNKGSTVPQTSAMGNAARFVRELTNARQWGKPFSVTEYGQPFWNSWRRESVALVPAYAALQGWDLISQFSENSIQLNYLPSSYSRKSAIYPYGIGADPVLHTGERLAALLYKRADIKPSPAQVRVRLDPETIFRESGGWGQLSENVSRLGLISAIGLDFGNALSSPASKVYVIEKGASASGLRGKASNVATRLGVAGSDNDRLIELEQSGLLQKSNLTDFTKPIFQSDTGELIMDVPSKRFSVQAEKTVVAVLPEGDVDVGILSVRQPSVPTLVALSSIDDAPLESSKRMLLFILTDAINSEMKFTDPNRSTLGTLGKLPVLLQSIDVKLKIRTKVRGAFKAFALSLAGERRELVPIRSGDELTLDIDTRLLEQGPTTLFELVQE